MISIVVVSGACGSDPAPPPVAPQPAVVFNEAPAPDPDAMADTWVGRWEDGTGYWIEVTATPTGLAVVRSGGPVHMDVLEVSEVVFVYRENGSGYGYRHTITLLSPGEASDEWADLTTNAVWTTTRLRKRQGAP